MNKLYAILLEILILSSCSTGSSTEPHVLIETDYGNIEVALYPEKAPKTVAAFLQHVDSGIYTNASFYRVLKNENVPEKYNTGLIQGGIFNTANASLPLKGIEHESPKQTGLSHVSGTISMARLAPGTAASEFFICIGDQKQFDSSSRGNSDGLGYAAFGKVVDGLDVAARIQNQKSTGDRFVRDIKISRIKRL
jgi:peptidyl-prolyl cis-trans isomerase A (cyclophilin A)